MMQHTPSIPKIAIKTLMGGTAALNFLQSDGVGTAMTPNDRDEARRAERSQHATHAESRRRLQHACSPSPSWLLRMRKNPLGDFADGIA